MARSIDRGADAPPQAESAPAPDGDEAQDGFGAGTGAEPVWPPALEASHRAGGRDEVAGGGRPGTNAGRARTGAAAAASAPTKVRTRSSFRTRVLPRSVLGISSLILAFAIGAGFSGVVLFSYYQYKLNQTNQRVNALISGYKKQFANAEGDLGATVAAARANIQNQLRAIQSLQAGPATLATLVRQTAPSVYFVHTLDANGQPSVGTAFIVSSNAGQSLLLTSYTTVEAATRSPSPPLYIRQGGTDTPVTVRSWDPQYDLALLVLPRGGLKPLSVAPPSPAPHPGDRVYAVSGLGSAGASITQGSIVDVSASGISEDAAIGSDFQGGPIVNSAGQVIAVASRSYAPLGFTSDGVWFAPYVEAACNKVLSCPNGTLVGSH